MQLQAIFSTQSTEVLEVKKLKCCYRFDPLAISLPMKHWRDSQVNICMLLMHISDFTVLPQRRKYGLSVHIAPNQHSYDGDIRQLNLLCKPVNLIPSLRSSPCKPRCYEALSLGSRAAPYVSFQKSKQRKAARTGDVAVKTE